MVDNREWQRQQRERALFDALWQLIESIDAIAAIRAGPHPADRNLLIDLDTAIQQASTEADAYSHEFPATFIWRRPIEQGER